MTQSARPAEVVGHNVQRILEERGWSHNELARRLGSSSPRVSMLCRGLHDPSLSFVVEIASILNCSVDELLAQNNF